MKIFALGTSDFLTFLNKNNKTHELLYDYNSEIDGNYINFIGDFNNIKQLIQFIKLILNKINMRKDILENFLGVLSQKSSFKKKSYSEVIAITHNFKTYFYFADMYVFHIKSLNIARAGMFYVNEKYTSVCKMYKQSFVEFDTDLKELISFIPKNKKILFFLPFNVFENENITVFKSIIEQIKKKYSNIYFYNYDNITEDGQAIVTYDPSVDNTQEYINDENLNNLFGDSFANKSENIVVNNITFNNIFINKDNNNDEQSNDFINKMSYIYNVDLTNIDKNNSVNNKKYKNKNKSSVTKLNNDIINNKLFKAKLQEYKFNFEPIIESVNESNNGSDIEPEMACIVQPTIEPVVEPVVEPVIEPVIEEEFVEITIEIESEEEFEPVVEPVVEPEPEPVVEVKKTRK